MKKIQAFVKHFFFKSMEKQKKTSNTKDIIKYIIVVSIILAK